MGKPISEQEKEEIKVMIQDDNLTLSQIMTISGRSKSAIYRICEEFDLVLPRKDPESPQDVHEAPYSESDRVVMHSAKGFIRNTSKGILDDCIATGQLLHEEYGNMARQHGLTVLELAKTGMAFFVEEGPLIEERKREVRISHAEITILKQQLSEAMSITNFVKEVVISSIANGQKPDYDTIFNGAKALHNIRKEIEGDDVIERGRTKGVESQIGPVEGRGDTKGIQHTETDSGPPGPQQPNDDDPGLIDDGDIEGIDVPQDDGKNDVGRPDPTEQ